MLLSYSWAMKLHISRVQSLAKWIYNITFMIDDILFAFIAAQTNLMPIHQKYHLKAKWQNTINFCYYPK